MVDVIYHHSVIVDAIGVSLVVTICDGRHRKESKLKVRVSLVVTICDGRHRKVSK